MLHPKIQVFNRCISRQKKLSVYGIFKKKISTCQTNKYFWHSAPHVNSYGNKQAYAGKAWIEVCNNPMWLVWTIKCAALSPCNAAHFILAPEEEAMDIRKKMSLSPAALALAATLLAHINLLLPQLAFCAVIPDGTYLIQMADSDHVVFFSTAESPPRVALKKHSTSAAWRFEHLGNDYFKII